MLKDGLDAKGEDTAGLLLEGDCCESCVAMLCRLETGGAFGLLVIPVGEANF